MIQLVMPPLTGCWLAVAVPGCRICSQAPASAGARRNTWKRVPPGKISIQLYTLREIMTGSGVDSTLAALAADGYPKVELAGLYGTPDQQAAREHEFGTMGAEMWFAPATQELLRKLFTKKR